MVSGNNLPSHHLNWQRQWISSDWRIDQFRWSGLCHLEISLEGCLLEHEVSRIKRQWEGWKGWMTHCVKCRARLFLGKRLHLSLQHEVPKEHQAPLTTELVFEHWQHRETLVVRIWRGGGRGLFCFSFCSNKFGGKPQTYQHWRTGNHIGNLLHFPSLRWLIGTGKGSRDVDNRWIKRIFLHTYCQVLRLL